MSWLAYNKCISIMIFEIKLIFYDIYGNNAQTSKDSSFGNVRILCFFIIAGYATMAFSSLIYLYVSIKGLIVRSLNVRKYWKLSLNVLFFANQHYKTSDKCTTRAANPNSGNARTGDVFIFGLNCKASIWQLHLYWNILWLLFFLKNVMPYMWQDIRRKTQGVSSNKGSGSW